MSDQFLDPVRYGVLWQKVEELDKKVDKLERGMDELLELANKSRGGFIFGMAVVSAVSGVISFFAGIYHAR